MELQNGLKTRLSGLRFPPCFLDGSAKRTTRSENGDHPRMTAVLALARHEYRGGRDAKGRAPASDSVKRPSATHRGDLLRRRPRLTECNSPASALSGANTAHGAEVLSSGKATRHRAPV